MDKSTFETYLRSGILLGDGATGTELARRGMPADVCPELWVAEHPEASLEVMQGYIAAGSRFVTSATFGGSPIKLARYGLEDRTEELNAACMRVARQAATDGVLAAANIGPTGELLQPMGMLSLDEMIACFRRQVAGLLEGQPDFFLLETFMDPAEARAAVLAIRELTDLPFVVSCTLQNGRTLTGATPEAIAVLFTALGASALGCNCSGGPDTMLGAVRAMGEYTGLPILAKPNAGMPQVVNGETVFRMGAEEFAAGVKALAEAGASIVGGCCGTTPAHIAALRQAIGGFAPPVHRGSDRIYLSSSRKIASIGGGTLCAIGERINPSGKEDLQADLQQYKADVALEYALDQMAAGVQALDVNVGAGGLDEARAMDALVSELSVSAPLPLFIDSSNLAALEAGLKGQCGRSVLNSVWLDGDTDAKLALARKYGAAAVLLPLNGMKVPADAAERLATMEQLLAKATEYGFDRRNLLIDVGTPCLSLCMSTGQDAVDFAAEMHRRGYRTIAGVSNISYKLPGRATLNAGYLAGLMAVGLDAAILNPTEDMMDIAAACTALRGSDEYCAAYITRQRGKA